MEAARSRGDDPRGAPELQPYGLNLVGRDQGTVVAAANSPDDLSIEGVVFGEKAASDPQNRLEVCRKDEGFVWAQPRSCEEVATTFVFAPSRRGTIEKYATVDPLPPLVVQTSSNSMSKSNSLGDSGEGVACYGEPSVDPSRSAQAGTIGDSEWWE